MADETNGIDLMRRRMERARRTAPPPPRRPAEASAARPAAATDGTTTEPVGEGTAAPATAPTARRSSRRPSARTTPARLAPDLPPVNLAIRVRRPLDDRLVDLIHGLRRGGLRTSKVELIEMLLWELPEEATDELRDRLGRFRAHAPRGAGAAFGDGG
ncbi:MAG: hypothetical protein AB7V42_17180 [Thermoleophilia bacterium]